MNKRSEEKENEKEIERKKGERERKNRVCERKRETERKERELLGYYLRPIHEVIYENVKSSSPRPVGGWGRPLGGGD